MNPSPFNPSPSTTDQVLHLFSDTYASFHDIASEFKTTVPALCLWLSRPDIAQKLADLRSAGAERTRTVAALWLPRAIPALMQIVDDFTFAASHRLDDPRDPATPILQLRERESVRKAIFLIYRLANFTDKPVAPRVAVPRVARASELPVRSGSDSPTPPVASTSSRCRETSESPAIRATDCGSEQSVPSSVSTPRIKPDALNELLASFSSLPATPPESRPVRSACDASRESATLASSPTSPLHAEGVAFSNPGWRRGGEATPWVCVESNPDPIGVVVASDPSDESNQPGSSPNLPRPAPPVARGILSDAPPPHPEHESRMPIAECLPPDHQSHITDHFFPPFAPPSIPSKSTSPSAPFVYPSRPPWTTPLPRRSRAGPVLQSA